MLMSSLERLSHTRSRPAAPPISSTVCACVTAASSCSRDGSIAVSSGRSGAAAGAALRPREPSCCPPSPPARNSPSALAGCNRGSRASPSRGPATTACPATISSAGQAEEAWPRPQLSARGAALSSPSSTAAAAAAAAFFSLSLAFFFLALVFFFSFFRCSSVSSSSRAAMLASATSLRISTSSTSPTVLAGFPRRRQSSPSWKTRFSFASSSFCCREVLPC
mmetsp:Transcript_40806/g.115413  ORF Transcript_40806/g.115413 Transcript_40806/m.115413 type:complete len:222 (-) Transcript_40806:240-905(-)